MKKILILLGMLISTAWADPGAFIVNSLAETMSRIDIVSGGVQNHVTVLGDTPNDIDLDGNYLYVVNSISAELQKIDPVSFTSIVTIPLPVGSNPYAVDVAGNYAFVSGWVSGVVYRINLIQNRIDSTVSIGDFPEGVLYYNGRLYVTETAFNPSDFSYGQGRMAVIDANTFDLISEVDVGANPQSIMLAPDGILHIICTGNYSTIEGRIYIYNTNSVTLQDSILIGGQPVSGVISRDGIGYLAAGGWISNGIVLSYDIHSKQILRGVDNPIEVGLGATDIALDSLGYIYTTDFGNDTVTKLASNDQVVNTYHMGDGPQALVIMDDRSTDNIDDPESPELPQFVGLVGNYPNPFNGNTIIRYNLTDGSQGGEIRIYDIQGRIIRNLYLGTAFGPGEVIWTGRDATGMECASGVYLARLVWVSGKGRGFLGGSLRIAFIK